MDYELRILLVDDSKVMRGIIRRMLAPWRPVRLLEASDGKQAWDLLQTETVDVIISDWNMPRMKGIDLLRCVRGNGALARTPFIMVTAEALEDNKEEADAAAVTAYLTKPFTSERLWQAIEGVLN